MADGKYIVVEGIAGVGKTTLIERLARELQAAQIPVQVMTGTAQPQGITAQAIQRIIDDPRYPVSNHSEVLLYNAARAQALEAVRQAVSGGAICLADHSYLTTLVHEYYGRGDITDYATADHIVQYAAGSRQPDLLILLDAPVSTLKPRLSADRQAVYDEAYAERLRAGYLWEAKQRGLPVIYATEPADTVFAAAWQQLSAVVNTPGAQPTAQPANRTSNTQSVAEVLAANPPVQANPVEPPVVASAAPATSGESAADPAAPAVAGSPDAAGHSRKTVTFDALSELAAGKLLRYGNPARVTRTAPDFGAKDAAGRYRYYTPSNLGDDLQSQYIRGMDQLFDAYIGLVTTLTKHAQAASAATDRAGAETQARAALQPLLPAAATAATTLQISVRAFEGLAAHLHSDELPEINLAGQQLAATDSDTAKYRAGTFQAVQKLAGELLPIGHTASAAKPVTLTGYTPRSELDIVADILYEHSDLPLADIQRAAARTPYQRKTDVLQAYLGDQPDNRRVAGVALDSVRYSFDIISSYAAFRELQQLRPLRRAAWQRLSPRLGYDMPLLVEAAGASEVFEQCFDLSLRLYSALQAGGFPVEAQYATLLGHRLRWHVTITARGLLDLHQALAAPHHHLNEPARAVIQLVFAQTAEVHPVLSGALHI